MEKATTTYDNLETLTTAISPIIRKYAAHYSGSALCSELSAMSQDAQELYQVAMAEIVAKFEAGSTLAYYKKMANWRMLKVLDASTTYYRYVGAEDELGDDEISDDMVIDRIAGYETTPEDTLIIREEGDKIQRILGTLSPEHQLIIRLLAEGLDRSDIAAKLGIPYETCRKRLVKIKEIFAQAGLTPSMALA